MKGSWPTAHCLVKSVQSVAISQGLLTARGGFKENKRPEWSQHGASTMIDVPMMMVSISIDGDVYQISDRGCGILV